MHLLFVFVSDKVFEAKKKTCMIPTGLDLEDYSRTSVDFLDITVLFYVFLVRDEEV